MEMEFQMLQRYKGNDEASTKLTTMDNFYKLSLSNETKTIWSTKRKQKIGA